MDTFNPHFVASGFESRLYRQHNEVLTQGILDPNVEVAILSLIEDQDVLVLRRAYLVPENSAASAFCIDLCVVESSELVKSDLSIWVENQHWHQYILVQIFHNNVERRPWLLGVNNDNGKISLSVVTVHIKLLKGMD